MPTKLGEGFLDAVAGLGTAPIVLYQVSVDQLLIMAPLSQEFVTRAVFFVTSCVRLISD